MRRSKPALHCPSGIARRPQTDTSRLVAIRQPTDRRYRLGRLASPVWASVPAARVTASSRSLQCRAARRSPRPVLRYTPQPRPAEATRRDPASIASLAGSPEALFDRAFRSCYDPGRVVRRVEQLATYVRTARSATVAVCNSFATPCLANGLRDRQWQTTKSSSTV